MFKKNYKRLLLFTCLMLLISGLILGCSSTKNLSLIDYPAMFRYVEPYIPFGF